MRTGSHGALSTAARSFGPITGSPAMLKAPSARCSTTRANASARSSACTTCDTVRGGMGSTGSGIRPSQRTGTSGPAKSARSSSPTWPCMTRPGRIRTTRTSGCSCSKRSSMRSFAALWRA